MKINLEEIYDLLFKYYGPQGWWPGEGLEIAIGAILTQQTNWSNVEKAIECLKEENCLNIECLQKITLEALEKLIRSSGYYKAKAKTLKKLISLLIKDPQPDREALLSIKGIGNETADSILLYWFEQPYFVVDAYTFRIFQRLGYYEGEDYLKLQRVFMEILPSDIKLYNEYHALIVRHTKEHCVKNNPRCSDCPLAKHCSYVNKQNI